LPTEPNTVSLQSLGSPAIPSSKERQTGPLSTSSTGSGEQSALPYGSTNSQDYAANTQSFASGTLLNTT